LGRLGDIAAVREGLTVLQEEVSSFDGEPAIEIGVYRVGNQTPQGVSAAVRAMMPEIMADLPPDIKFAIQHDSSEVYQQRLELLLKNGFFGLILVLVLLSLFLEFKLRSEEHTSELQSRENLVCRLLLEKKDSKL